MTTSSTAKDASAVDHEPIRAYRVSVVRPSRPKPEPEVAEPEVEEIPDRETPDGSLARVLRVLRAETELFDPRQLLAQSLASALPQLTFNRVRTAVLRAGGMRIGARSLILGAFKVTGHGLWNQISV